MSIIIIPTSVLGIVCIFSSAEH